LCLWRSLQSLRRIRAAAALRAGEHEVIDLRVSQSREDFDGAIGERDAVLAGRFHPGRRIFQ
jgi:hypothetical protein